MSISTINIKIKIHFNDEKDIMPNVLSKKEFEVYFFKRFSRYANNKNLRNAMGFVPKSFIHSYSMKGSLEKIIEFCNEQDFPFYYFSISDNFDYGFVNEILCISSEQHLANMLLKFEIDTKYEKIDATQ